MADTVTCGWPADGDAPPYDQPASYTRDVGRSCEADANGWFASPRPQTEPVIDVCAEHARTAFDAGWHVILGDGTTFGALAQRRPNAVAERVDGVLWPFLGDAPVDASVVERDPLDIFDDVDEATNSDFLGLVHKRLDELVPVTGLGYRARDAHLLLRLRRLAVSLQTITAAGGFAAPADGAYAFPSVTVRRGGIDFSAAPATGSGGFLFDPPPPPDLTDPVVVMRLAADELIDIDGQTDLWRALHDCANALIVARRPKTPVWKNAMWRGRRALADWADPDRADR